MFVVNILYQLYCIISVDFIILCNVVSFAHVQLLKPRTQRERAQWEVGVGHAEAANAMTREERNDNYTFIYIDKLPADAEPSDDPVTPTRMKKRRTRRSKSLKKDDPATLPRRQQPRRQCSVSDTQEEEAEPEDTTERQPSPPPVRTPWRTAAARKLLPLSVTMKKLNVEIVKCDWQLPKEKVEIKKEVERDDERVQSPEVRVTSAFDAVLKPGV